MNADRLLEDLPQLLELADEVAARDRRPAKRRSSGGRGRTFYKTPYGDALRKAADDGDDGDDGDEPNAHARAKSAHHEAMAEAYRAVSGLHGKMARHYSSGAQGAHTDAGDDADADDVEDVIEKVIVIPADEAELRAAARDGSVSARLRVAALEKDAVVECRRHPQFGTPRRPR